MSALEVIFPKVRGEIMRLLFSDPAKEFHLRELSRLSSLALGTIQQEVSKLTRADLLVARRDGNRLYYRANTGHPIFSELQGIALKTTGLREQLADALAGVPGIEWLSCLAQRQPGPPVRRATWTCSLSEMSGCGRWPPSCALSLRYSDARSTHTSSHATPLRPKHAPGAHSLPMCLPPPKIWITGDADELEGLV